jgi:molybdate transport system substrate-binding protein
MRRDIIFAILIAGILLLSGCAQAPKAGSMIPEKEITVFAAASLKEALVEIKAQFEQSTNIKLVLNLASSGTLQKQIEEGAPADLFISAGKKQMDALENKSLIVKDSRIDLLKNSLVLIVSREYKDKVKTAADLTEVDAKISIGEPETVPAGQYARESLQHMNLWDSISAKLVFAKDVKQVLTYVEQGEAAAGIVYSSDAIVMKDGTIAQKLDESTHSPIMYPAAIVSASKEKNSAKAFCDYMMSAEGQKVFEEYGFSIAKR